MPEPEPPPVTTIAWRLGHLIVGVLGSRASNHFGAGGVDYETFNYAGTAAGALANRTRCTARRSWVGVRGLGNEGLARPCAHVEGPFADHPMAELMLHINRETIRHGHRNHPAARSVPPPNRLASEEHIPPPDARWLQTAGSGCSRILMRASTPAASRGGDAHIIALSRP